MPNFYPIVRRPDSSKIQTDPNTNPKLSYHEVSKESDYRAKYQFQLVRNFGRGLLMYLLKISAIFQRHFSDILCAFLYTEPSALLEKKFRFWSKCFSFKQTPIEKGANHFWQSSSLRSQAHKLPSKLKLSIKEWKR